VYAHSLRVVFNALSLRKRRLQAETVSKVEVTIGVEEGVDEVAAAGAGAGVETT